MTIIILSTRPLPPQSLFTLESDNPTAVLIIALLRPSRMSEGWSGLVYVTNKAMPKSVIHDVQADPSSLDEIFKRDVDNILSSCHIYQGSLGIYTCMWSHNHNRSIAT